jgi:predicted negative regulator of RcsB-dependent stress response
VKAERLFAEALTGAREVEDAELEALARLNFAQVRLAQNDLSEATSMVSEAFGHFVASENRWRQVECLCVLADIAEREGQAAQARVHLTKGREIALAIHAQIELERIEARLARA